MQEFLLWFGWENDFKFQINDTFEHGKAQDKITENIEKSVNLIVTAKFRVVLEKYLDKMLYCMADC